MAAIRKVAVSPGITWLEVPQADLRVLCGCPADAVKHLLKRGFIRAEEIAGVPAETGPNAILLSDLPLQNGRACNRAEFPVLQMLYRQGMLLPNHPRNTGRRPVLLGARREVDAQMQYIFRGNYGLASEAELIAAGVAPELAQEMMGIKRGFAFGRIHPTADLLEGVYIEGGGATLAGGVRVRRLRRNVFEFAYADEHCEVDLNLAPGQVYECPYALGKHLLRREYFAVVHTGDGDGWDPNRPCMGSIVMYQGRVYLVDAGPNIDAALTALGIGVNEVDGIFHTHCHDDHLLGLTTLIAGDRRIPYYAVPMVADSVVKKIASVMQFEEEEFRAMFDMRPLALDVWNDIEGLEVMPVYSPHPVETTILRFRTMWAGGYRSYAHLADIASARVMRTMTRDSAAGAPGLSPERIETTLAAYREAADVKKVDIGGGLIHGEAQDFHGDGSGKLILAHTARALTEEERRIGAGAPFGTVDVLIEERSDVLRRRAFGFLREYFETAPMHGLRQLMNADVVTFNPESMVMRQGAAVTGAYLVLCGSVEMLREGMTGCHGLSAGSIIGETEALLGLPAGGTYRAVSFVQALWLPRDLYLDFATRCGVYESIVVSQAMREFLRASRLFADGVSCTTLNRLVDAAGMTTLSADAPFEPPEETLYLLRDGEAELTTPAGYREALGAGTHVGATRLARGAHRGALVRPARQCAACALPLAALQDIPVVRWKLLETHRRRYGVPD